MNDKDKIGALISEAERVLAKYGLRYNNYTWRKKVLLLVDLLKTVKTLGIWSSLHAVKVGCAREFVFILLNMSKQKYLHLN